MKKIWVKKIFAAFCAAVFLTGSGIVTTNIQAEETASGYTVSFDANGGSAAAPVSESATAANNDTVTLPAYEGTKQGYTFAGWAVVNDLTSSTYYSVYAPGSQLTVSSDTVLYAVWTQSVTASFYIRLDGTTPYEPSQYSGSSYTAGITIANVVIANTWVCDTTGTRVLANLNAVPTDAQIQAVYPSYDPTSQYVTWYVIKYAGSWHVDGVIQSKAKINLTYDGNGSGDVTNVPLGSQYYVGNDVIVGSTGGNSGAVTVPSRQGYTFAGWNTAADGSGTAYASGSSMTINASTVLYAQWTPNNKTAYTVQWINAETGKVMKSVVRYGATGNTAAVAASDKSLTDYTYAGDNYAGTVLSGTISGDGSLTLKIYFTETQYNVIYEDASGNVMQTTSEKKGQTIASYTGSEPVKAADDTYTYAFSGWQLASGTEGADSTVGTTDLIYTPIFDETYIDYTVNYDLNGGEEADETQLSYSQLHQGDSTPKIADPTKASDDTYNYTFAGWSPAVTDTVTGNVTYTAQWTAAKIMTITASSIEETYNGSAYTLAPAVVDTDNALIEYSTDQGVTWSEGLPSRTDAGTTEVLIRASKEGYTTAETTATITVDSKTVVLTSASDSKTYDGSALTNTNVTADGFVDGQGASYLVDGTQTAVGTSANTFTYVLNENTKAANYDITTEEGTLTVTDARPITPTTNDGSSTSSDSSSSTSSLSRPSTPNTGDATNISLFAGLTVFSVLAAAVVLFIKHRHAS
jgi:uncharacterized repeat protein (TIGR02543 family)